MKCPCRVDHWLHLALGFQGIVGMMVNLEAQGVQASETAIQKMEEQLEKLKERIEKQKHHQPPETE